MKTMIEKAIDHGRAKSILGREHQTIYRWFQPVDYQPEYVEMARMCRTIQELEDCFLLETDTLDKEHIDMYLEKFHPDKVPFYVVRFAKLPPMTTTADFLVQGIIPAKCVPTILQVSLASLMIRGPENGSLKRAVLDYITQLEGMPRPKGFRGVDDIQLVECDLLTPKEE